MAQTFCGKSCDVCGKKEVLNCPGCRIGPGRSIQGDCKIAQCCRSRGHETCKTCNASIRCGLYLRKEHAPDDRLKRMNVEQERLRELARRAPIIARWMRVLFWLLIPNLIGSILTNDSVNGIMPGLNVVGEVLQLAGSVVYCYAIFALSKLEESYRKAGLYILISVGISLLSTIVGSGVNIVLGIPSVVVVILGIYHELCAHSNLMEEVDSHISEDWRALWKFYLAGYIIMYGSVALAGISVVLTAIALIVGAIMILILGIFQAVLLFQSAKQADILAVRASKE